ncbi:MAG TPA: hypothetical protein VJB66_03270 [Candidatus Nanoarchaeia archaeon]|nr:hypothetical protein [Candidatus Nanoarchaeia archaeon]
MKKRVTVGLILVMLLFSSCSNFESEKDLAGAAVAAHQFSVGDTFWLGNKEEFEDYSTDDYFVELRYIGDNNFEAFNYYYPATGREFSALDPSGITGSSGIPYSHTIVSYRMDQGAILYRSKDALLLSGSSLESSDYVDPAAARLAFVSSSSIDPAPTGTGTSGDTVPPDVVSSPDPSTVSPSSISNFISFIYQAAVDANQAAVDAYQAAVDAYQQATDTVSPSGILTPDLTPEVSDNPLYDGELPTENVEQDFEYYYLREGVTSVSSYNFLDTTKAADLDAIIRAGKNGDGFYEVPLRTGETMLVRTEGTSRLIVQIRDSENRLTESKTFSNSDGRRETTREFFDKGVALPDRRITTLTYDRGSGRDLEISIRGTNSVIVGGHPMSYETYQSTVEQFLNNPPDNMDSQRASDFVLFAIQNVGTDGLTFNGRMFTAGGRSAQPTDYGGIYYVDSVPRELFIQDIQKLAPQYRPGQPLQDASAESIARSIGVDPALVRGLLLGNGARIRIDGSGENSIAVVINPLSGNRQETRSSFYTDSTAFNEGRVVIATHNSDGTITYAGDDFRVSRYNPSTNPNSHGFPSYTPSTPLPGQDRSIEQVVFNVNTNSLMVIRDGIPYTTEGYVARFNDRKEDIAKLLNSPEAEEFIEHSKIAESKRADSERLQDVDRSSPDGEAGVQDETPAARNQAESEAAARNVIGFDGERAFTDFFQYYRSQQALSSLLLDKAFKSNWMEDVDKAFAQTHLGIEYWSSDICRKEFDVIGEDVGVIEAAPGIFQFIGHVEAEISEKLPMLCGEDDTCAEGTCRLLDRQCVDIAPSGRKSEDVLKEEYVYKITVGVTAPDDEDLTPNRDEEGAVSFNIIVKGSGKSGTLFNKPIELKGGESFQQVFIETKPSTIKNVPVQYNEVCLVFTKKAKSYDGKDVDRICNDISIAQMKFITGKDSVAATPQGQAAAQICPTCW